MTEKNKLIKELDREIKEYMNTPRDITNCDHKFDQRTYLIDTWFKQCSKCTALKNLKGEIF